MKRISAIVSATAAVAFLLAGCGSNEETAPDAAQTTCREFKELDNDAQKSLIEQILTENPDSPFSGSPNVALGTAKLVCNAESVADTPVADAAGILVD